tara:strand:+ start:727 stop:1446 length:720 start_codon:yes stop_codon:yes gene_type:complete
MAGGLGNRMRSDTPKVLHKVKDLPMIVHVINSALKINPFKICIITGRYFEHIYEMITRYITLNIIASKIKFINQPEALGTGNAIMCCKPYLLSVINEINNVIILSGDVPLIKSTTIGNLLDKCKYVNLLACHVDNSHGYGRIILDKNKFVKIVEEKDCTNEEKLIKFVNTGIYAFNKDILVNNIDKITNNNSQNEYYLTDILEIINKDCNINIDYEIIEDSIEVTGVNTLEQLHSLNNL